MVKALIAAGGSGKRMGCNKLLMEIGGLFVIERTILAFKNCKAVDSIIVATDDDKIKQICKHAAKDKPLSFVSAGSERQYSVKNGLELVDDEDIVLIHDGARPFVSVGLIERCIESAQKFGSGVAALPVYDSLKRADKDMVVTETIDRSGVFAMQTPQGFLGRLIKKAHEQDVFGTDDAFLLQEMGEDVKLVMGEKANVKLTVIEDLKDMNNLNYRIGQGYDVHKLVKGRRLIICGVDIPYEYGLDGHSDADVATHALMDAMLGAASLGDIGKLFPDSDEQFKGADSIELLKEVNRRILELGYRISNCDITIAAQKPKLAPYIDDMRSSIANAVNIPEHDVNVKATTTEGLGFVGREEGISALCVCMLEKVLNV